MTQPLNTAILINDQGKQVESGVSSKYHPAAQGLYVLPAKQEFFAQQIAANPGSEQGLLYAKVYGLDPTNPIDLKAAGTGASRLMATVAVRLRIQELMRPALRKLKHKIEYGLQNALEQCQIAYDMSMESGDVKSLLKAIELQSKLSKLLSEDINVNHRYGVLDSASTDVLLEMRAAIEAKRAKRKLLSQPAIIIDGAAMEVKGYAGE